MNGVSSDLKGKLALVTGAGRGIGRAISCALAQAGATVVAAARSQDQLESLVDEIRQSGGDAHSTTSDLSDSEAPSQLVASVRQQVGRNIDILVNNAGVGSSADPRPFVDFDDDFWRLSIQVNLTAPYLLAKEVVPAMVEQGWGRIITVASVNSRTGSLHGVAYSASKHGVLGLTRTLAIELAGTGVTVNAICPGPVRTLMNDKRIAYDAERMGQDLETYEQGLTPIGGRLDPEDIAPMAVYLASDAGRMITGQGYNICGGLSMP